MNLLRAPSAIAADGALTDHSGNDMEKARPSSVSESYHPMNGRRDSVSASSGRPTPSFAEALSPIPRAQHETVAAVLDTVLVNVDSPTSGSTERNRPSLLGHNVQEGGPSKENTSPVPSPPRNQILWDGAFPDVTANDATTGPQQNKAFVAMDTALRENARMKALISQGVQVLEQRQKALSEKTRMMREKDRLIERLMQENREMREAKERGEKQRARLAKEKAREKEETRKRLYAHR
jgi:hypothetical protein